MLDELIARVIGPQIELILAMVTGVLLSGLVAVLGEWRNIEQKEREERRSSHGV